MIRLEDHYYYYFCYYYYYYYSSCSFHFRTTRKRHQSQELPFLYSFSWSVPRSSSCIPPFIAQIENKSFAGVCLFLQYSRIQHTLIERDPECLTLAHRISFSSKEKSSLATGFPIIHRLGAPGWRDSSYSAEGALRAERCPLAAGSGEQLCRVAAESQHASG